MRLADLRKYDPAQPRDGHGRWTDSGAGAGAAGAAAGAVAGAAAAAGAGQTAIQRTITQRLAARAIARANHRVPEVAQRLTGVWAEARKARIDRALKARQAAIRRPFRQPAGAEPADRPSPVSLRVRQIRRREAAIPEEAKAIETRLESGGAQPVPLSEVGLDMFFQPEEIAPGSGVHAPALPLAEFLDLTQQRHALDREAEGLKAERERLLDARPPKFGPRRAHPVQRHGSGKVWLRSGTERLRTWQGDLPQAEMKTIRDKLRAGAGEIAQQARAHADAMRTSPQWQQRAERALAARFARLSEARVGKPVRLGLILGAAALGGAGGALIGRETGRRLGKGCGADALAKAADDTQAPDATAAAEQVHRAGAKVEDPLAERLARTFGSWTKLPLHELSTRTAALRSTLLTGLDRAMAPLDAAARGGAGATVPAAVPDDDGHPRILSFSFDTGSQRVNDYIRDKRLKLAGNMADEQLATIRTVLQDGILNGQAPAKTARILKQTIGLAPSQAQHVLSYRRQLEALDPNALNRALRDARFDGTVKRAIGSDQPLSEAQINKMVDAYHRRYLAYRAMTIARTEGLSAANNGHAAAVQAYLDKNPGFTVIKTWMATEDDHTRPDHQALDGQKVIGLYTPFRAPSGDTILWPHHPDAPARQVCNCRCSWAVTLVPRTGAAQHGLSLAPDLGSMRNKELA